LTKLAKYLKPFIFGLILSVGLLFIQALTNLNLPNYMSEIVNIGIQQSGIEHGSPDALSVNGFKLTTTFMSESERQLVSENYLLVASDDKNPDGKKYRELYPNAGDDLYVLRETDEVTREALDNAFGASVWTFMLTMQDLSEQSGSKPTDLSEGFADIDTAELYKLLPMLENLPEPLISAAHEKALKNDENIMKQSSIMFARALYTELGANVGEMQNAYILRIGLLMLAVALVGGFSTVLVSLLSSRISAGVAKNLRSDTFNKIESFSNAEFDRFSTASLITRCTNDITQIQMFLMMGIRMILYAPIIGIGGVIMAIGKSPSMSWIIAIVCVILAGIILVIMAIALPKFKSIQKLVDRLNLVSRENLSGIMVIRAFGTQRHETKRFEAANSDLTRTSLFINRVMVFMMPVMMLIMNGTSLIIVWVGAHQIADSATQVGDMMAFMQYAMQIIMAFLMFSMMFIFIPRAAVSAGRIADVLKTEISVKDPENPKPFDGAKKGLVEFRGVSFRYEGAEEDSLCDINFTSFPGQTTAIIGSTGSGKSTIANLTLRFYDVTQGSILVDGVDIREVKQKDLRSVIGYVPQKGVLLSGTVASNLKYGRKEAQEHELQTSAEVAQAIDFITSMPKGFDSEISQGGTNVSGGQKQRLSIARAMVKNPEIFIFDDSFSAVDYKTETALRHALKEHTGESTVIVVAQRVSTIMYAEQIIVLDNGRIVGHGTHSELLKNCPEYYDIALSQLSQEELA
jgi:ATP-binding cassette subfamily B multidrug efflux pump